MTSVLTKWAVLEDWLVQWLSSNKDTLGIILGSLKLDAGLISSRREEESMMGFLRFTILFAVHVDLALQSYIWCYFAKDRKVRER